MADLGEGSGGGLFWVKKQLQKEEKPAGQEPPLPLLAQGLDPPLLTYKSYFIRGTRLFNKLTSVFHASVLLLIMNFVITLSK